jgi:hypothetical protein
MKRLRFLAYLVAAVALLVAAWPSAVAAEVAAPAGQYSDLQVGEMQGILSDTHFRSVFGGLVGDPASHVVTIYLAPSGDSTRVAGGRAAIGRIGTIADPHRNDGSKKWKIRYVTAAPSLADLDSVMQKVPSSNVWANNLVSYGIDPRRHAVLVTVESITSKIAADSAAAFGNTVQLEVGQRIRPYPCPAPSYGNACRLLDIRAYYGGDRIVDSGGGQCSGGFAAWDPAGDRGMLTAGHCGPPQAGSLWSQGYKDGAGVIRTTGVMGNITHRQWGDNVTDAEFLDATANGTTVQPTIYTTVDLTALTPHMPVGNAGISFLGMTGVCAGGSFSGENCGGTVQQVDICISSYNYVGGAYNVCNITAVTPSTLAGPGDSGGPVYTYSGSSVTAYGLIQGGNGTYFVYSELTQALSELGVGLITSSGNQPVPQNFGNALYHDQYLHANQYLLAANAAYELIMQGDGNLVLYSTTRSTWNSATQGNPGAFAVMQGDGNFVVYTANWRALWNSGTQGNPGAYVTLRNDGVLAIYTQAGNLIWHRP